MNGAGGRRAALGLLLLCAAAAAPAEEGARPGGGAAPRRHLFILSGQSNMVGLDPAVTFTPTLQAALPGDTLVVVRRAWNGEPIRRWYKTWKPKTGEGPKADGILYDQLMREVRAAIWSNSPATVTFVWMQGERDARESHGDVYAAALRGLIAQLKADLGRPDVNVVLGRISDFDLDNRTYPHWTLVRKAQEDVAVSEPRTALVDTDGLNGQANALHYTEEGYAELGRRFAARAAELIRGGAGH